MNAMKTKMRPWAVLAAGIITALAGLGLRPGAERRAPPVDTSSAGGSRPDLGIPAQEEGSSPGGGDPAQEPGAGDPEQGFRDAVAAIDRERLSRPDRLADTAGSGWWSVRPGARGKSAVVERRTPDWAGGNPPAPEARPRGRSERPSTVISQPGRDMTASRNRTAPRGTTPMPADPPGPGHARAKAAVEKIERDAPGKGSGKGPAASPPGRRAPEAAGPGKTRPAGPVKARPKTPAKAAPRTPPRTPVFRPILLSRLLGTKAIRPPAGRITVPDLRYLDGKVPPFLPDGRPLVVLHPEPGQVEASQAPDPKAFAQDGPCPKAGHWHRDGGALRFHAGEAWGLWREGRWSWHARKESRWWAAAGPAIPTLLRHHDRWWWNASGLWFLLHEGQPWGYRQLTDLGLDALVHPSSGTTMVYSADASRVAVITPGQGAVLFDAATGEVLGRWTEDQMPKPRRPKAPSSLAFPR